MKALVSEVVGGPETLRLVDLPDPVPGPTDVVIDVRAVGINFPDALIIQDRYQFKAQRPFSPGAEVSGVVAAVGTDVTRVRPGDRVIGQLPTGGMAEKALVADDKCRPIPDGMPFDEAAAMLMTYGTSHYALKDRGRLAPGETLLVLGAAGGVGIAAVEIGKAMGARVIGAVSSDAKAAFVRDVGADATVVYPADLDGGNRVATKALADQFKLVSGGGVDVVYDGVGGPYAEPAIRAMNWDGRFLVVGFPAGIPSVPLNLTLLKSCQIVGVFWGAFTMRSPAENESNLADLFRLYESGAIRPRVSARFPLERGGEAIAHLEQRRALGKVVVTVGR